MKTLFEKEYDGESIVDAFRDVPEAFDERFNPNMVGLPKDEYNLNTGTFIVKIEWKPDD